MEQYNQAIGTVENGGQEEVVAPQQEGGPDTGAGGNAGPASQPQSHQDNAAARAARIRAEQETTQRLRKQYDDQVAGMGIVNPYTGQPFRNFKDFLDYGEKFKADKLAEEAKRKGTTVEAIQEEEETKSWIQQKRKEDAVQKQAMAALEARNQFVLADLHKFVEKYPDVDPGKLEKIPSSASSQAPGCTRSLLWSCMGILWRWSATRSGRLWSGLPARRREAPAADRAAARTASPRTRGRHWTSGTGTTQT